MSADLTDFDWPAVPSDLEIRLFGNVTDITPATCNCRACVVHRHLAAEGRRLLGGTESSPEK